MASTSKQMTQKFGRTTAVTTTQLTDNGCQMIPANGPFGNKTIGPRTVIVPADPLEWNNGTTYEYLTLVLAESGNSYISKRDVPAGTPVTNTDYWIKSSDWNAQLADIQDHLDSMIIVPEMFGDKSADDTAILNAAIATGMIVDGRGNTYNISNINVDVPLKLQNIKLVAIQDNVDSLIICPRNSYFLKCEIDGKGLCNNIVETIVAQNASTPATSFISCNFYAAKNSIIKTGSVIQTDLCKFSVSENGIIANCSDNKIFNSVFTNCRCAINCSSGSGGMTVDNCHAWVTRNPSQSPLYSPNIDNSDYPGTSCFFKLGSNFPNINVGMIYCDTLTYVLIVESDSPTYALVNIEKINGFFNTSFYTRNDPQPQFMNNNNLIGGTNNVYVGNALLDFNGLTGPEGEYYSTYFPASLTAAQESVFIVKSFVAKGFNDDIANYQYTPFYTFATETTAEKLGAFSVHPVLIKEHNNSRILLRAGISEPINANEVILTAKWNQSIQYQYPSCVPYFYGTDGSRKELIASIQGDTLTVTNVDSITQDGVIIVG